MPHIFLNELRKSGGVGTSGQITKLTTLLNAVKMLVISVPDNGGDDDTKDIVGRAKVIETKIKGISKSLRRVCFIIRLQQRYMFDSESDLRDRVLEFPDDLRLTKVVSGYEEMEEGEKLMTRFLMCSMMFNNAQRQGAVVNLQVSEVKRAICHKTQVGRGK